MANFIKYGLIAAFLMSAYSLILFLIGSDLRFNTTVAYTLSIIVPILFLVLAVKAERSDQEGLISFGEAFKTSFLTYMLYTIIVTAVGFFVMGMWSEADWTKMLDIQRNTTSSMLSAVGMDQVQIDQALEEVTIESVKEQLSGVGALMMGILGSAFVGLILSLIISAIMKKNPTP